MCTDQTAPGGPAPPPAPGARPGAATEQDDLAGEREHLAAARAALRRMRERAEALFATGDGVAGDALGAESLGAALARRVAELSDQPDVPPFFGKLTHDHGETHHIGRRHVTDESGEPMVLDWRAPVSRAFYRASTADR
jgi:hypothetical protein